MSIAELKVIRPYEGGRRLPAAADVSAPPERRCLRWKGLFDRSLAALVLIPALPIIGLLVILVRRDSPGPGIFRQVRVGRNGVTFNMYKIRTMRVDAEAKTGAVWTQPGDSRITRLGHFLRKSHLDELPQLFNVLRGDMSLVGPRPERPEFVDVLAAEIPDYRRRLAVLPGVTGLAQINLPPDTDLDSVRRKQVLDLEYIRTASPWLDARMILCTSLRLFGCSGECAMRLMRLQRPVPHVCQQPQGDTATEDVATSPANRDTLVLGIGDTQTFDPAEVVKSLRALELRAAIIGTHQDATPLATDPPPPATPERLRQQAMVGGPANRNPPALREDAPHAAGRSSLAPRAEVLPRRSTPPTLNPPELSGAFTVDVEDYFHVTAFEDDIPRERWDEYPSRVVGNTQRILDLLARHRVHGTFFVLGWVAERFPKLVEAIHAAGHQIGSHGYWHRRIYQQTPDEFRADLQKTRDVLMDIIGEKVTAYRAPCFSVTKQSLWALDILAEEGFEQDCSIFPIHHDRYGIPDAEGRPHRIATSAGLVWEFPPATRRLAGLNLPVAGGGYFRLLPAWWTIRSLKATWRTTSRPFIFYIHPWELDAAQPRLGIGSRLSRFRHYVNLGKTEGKLQALLESFHFGRLDQVLNTLSPPSECPIAENRYASPDGIPRPGEAAKGGMNGHPAFRRSPECHTCPWNDDEGPQRGCRCRAPVYELAAPTCGADH